jgi:bifunctional non-homologous end joining protein LigD
VDKSLARYPFDVLIHRGRNVLRLPLEERHELLTEALAKVQYPVLPSVAFEAKPADLIRAAKELGLEGIIAKRKGSVYCARPAGSARRTCVAPSGFRSRTCFRPT